MDIRPVDSRAAPMFTWSMARTSRLALTEYAALRILEREKRPMTASDVYSLLRQVQGEFSESAVAVTLRRITVEGGKGFVRSETRERPTSGERPPLAVRYYVLTERGRTALANEDRIYAQLNPDVSIRKRPASH